MSCRVTTTQSLVFIGMGTVGQGLLEILVKKQSQLEADYGVKFKVLGVSTGSRGKLYDPQGLDLNMLLELSKHRDIFQNHLYSGSTEALIREAEADVVIEMSPTNLQSGEPAISHCKWAFKTESHVVCANKGPAALD